MPLCGEPLTRTFSPPARERDAASHQRHGLQIPGDNCAGGSTLVSGSRTARKVPSSRLDLSITGICGAIFLSVNIRARNGNTAFDPGCVETHTSEKCRKHNSPGRHRARVCSMI
jgi:hypothetical protein